MPTTSGTSSRSIALSTAAESNNCSMADRGVVVTAREVQPTKPRATDAKASARVIRPSIQVATRRCPCEIGYPIRRPPVKELLSVSSPRLFALRA